MNADLSPLARALLTTINDHPRARVDLQLLRVTYARHDPTGAASSEARGNLARALDDLSAGGHITLPSSSRLYESFLQPRLPQWVQRAPRHRPAPAQLPARVWRQELTAAAAVARTAADFEVLSAVDTFLREGGASRPVVPHRERSLQLFGHEKRLDQLLRSQMFTSGALTLNLLRAYIAPLPLTASYAGPPGTTPTLLIVENHSTYASALTLARARAQAGQPALGIGWGGGNQIAAGERGGDPLAAAIGGVRLLDPVPQDIAYFGDLDVAGLRAPAGAARAALTLDLPRVRPALPLYRALLEHGTPAPDPGRAAQPHEMDDLVAWLDDDDLRTAVRELLRCGQRLAQEAVGFEVLSTIPTWT